MATKVIAFDTGTSITIPLDFGTLNFIDCIAAGGAANGSFLGQGFPGGAGAFARITTANLIGGNTYTCQIGLPAGTNVNGVTSGSPGDTANTAMQDGTGAWVVGANGGTTATTVAGPGGTTAKSLGTTKFKGGDGSGTGGGGAAGLNGAGANGSGNNGGQGDNGHGGTGGTSTHNGNPGAEYSVSQLNGTPNNTTVGSGGGGGGSTGVGNDGGNGGAYGAGGGAGNTGNDGNGAGGLIVISYVTADAAAIPFKGVKHTPTAYAPSAALRQNAARDDVATEQNPHFVGRFIQRLRWAQ